MCGIPTTASPTKALSSASKEKATGAKKTATRSALFQSQDQRNDQANNLKIARAERAKDMKTARVVSDQVSKKATKSEKTAKATKKTVRKPEAKSPTKTRLRSPKKTFAKRNENDWTYNKDEAVYILEPVTDVHKFTLIYLHYASGHPREYFEIDGFQTPGFRVVLPKSPVWRSLHYGADGETTSKSRLWYDYYYDPEDPKEDPTQGADAEELWDVCESDEDTEGVKREKKDDEPAEAAEPGEPSEPEEKPQKFSEFIKTVSPDSPPETNRAKEAQVDKSIDRVIAIIHKEAEALGGDYSRIFLGGWSQGAVLAMCAAIRKDCPSLGGVMTVTGTCQSEYADAALKEPPKSTPFVLYVGVKDDLYPVMLFKPVVERLRSVGYQIDFREKMMDHCLNGCCGPACMVEERWMKRWIAEMYDDTSLGALLTAPAALTLDTKDQEAALKAVYNLLFGNQLPHSRKAEVMKYSVWDGLMPELQQRVGELSAEDLGLVAKFFGASSCTAPDLARFLATPTAAGLAALRTAPN